jgi:hypothetical protein
MWEKEQAVELDAANLSDEWYTEAELEKLVRREGGSLKSVETMTAWALRHFRLAFRKGYWFGAQREPEPVQPVTMTTPQAREQQARALIYALTHRDTDWKCCLEDEVESIKIIVALLADTQRETLERVAIHIEDEHEKDFGHRRVLGAEGEIVAWCRQQADEVKG